MVNSDFIEKLNQMPIEKRVYALRNLPWQLANAERFEQLKQLLLVFDFLQEKLELTDHNAVLSDFILLRDDLELQLIYRALSMSVHALQQNKRLLAGQLIGRLYDCGNNPGIHLLLNNIHPFNPTLYPRSQALWSVDTPIHRFIRVHESVDYVTFSKDSKYLAILTSRNSASGHLSSIRIWDTDIGEEIKQFSLHGIIKRLHFTEDSLYCDPCDVSWNIKTWEQTPIERHSTAFSSTYSPNRQLSVNYLAYVPGGPFLEIQDVNSGQLIKRIKILDNAAPTISFSPNSAYLAYASEGKLTILDLQDWKEVPISKKVKSSVRSFEFSPDSTYIAVGAYYKDSFQLLRLPQGKPELTIQSEQSGITSFCFSADGTMLVTCGLNSTLAIWDTKTWNKMGTLYGHHTIVDWCHFSPNGKYLVSYAGRVIIFWNIDNWAYQNDNSIPRGFHHAFFSPDGKTLVTAQERGSELHSWNLENGLFVDTLRGDFRLTSRNVGFNSDWSTCAVLSTSEKYINLIDYYKKTIIRSLPLLHAKPTSQILFSPDDRQLATLSYDHTIILRDSQSGDVLNTLQNNQTIDRIAYSPDGSWIASSSNGFVSLWDTTSGEQLKHLRCPDYSTYNQLCFSPDGKTLAVSSPRDMGTWYDIIIWEIATSEVINVLKLHTHFIMDLAYYGPHLASCSLDCTLAIWDVFDGHLLTTFQADQSVQSCVWSPDGKHIAAGGKMNFMLFQLLTDNDLPNPLYGLSKSSVQPWTINWQTPKTTFQERVMQNLRQILKGVIRI